MRIVLVLALIAAAAPAAAADRPSGGFDKAHCLRAGKVVEPQSGAQPTCCYDDGCWVCGQGWQGCKWKAGSASLDSLRGTMGAPATGTAPAGTSGRSIPGAMQGSGAPAPLPGQR